MSNLYFSVERNIQIIQKLLKEHGIKKIIASPGATDMSIVNSLANDSWFEMYSEVDERGAAYLACGMASESGKPKNRLPLPCRETCMQARAIPLPQDMPETVSSAADTN